MDDRTTGVDVLVEQYLGGRIDRRAFLRRAPALGLSATAAHSLVPAYAAGTDKRSRTLRLERISRRTKLCYR
jgi:hypothetical protein